MQSRKKISGFSVIEMVVALFITSLVLLAVVVTFQNFVSFNNWVIHSSYMQKQAVQDLVRFERAFEDVGSFVHIDDVSASMQRVVGRDRGSVGFSFLSLISNRAIGEQVSILDTDGYLALHKGVFFGGMVQVGGSLFVVDTGAHVIREVNVETQVSSIYVGGEGQAGTADGLGSLARFRNPTGIAYYNNQLYIADTGNHTVRVIAMNSNELLRSVSTFAGNAEVAGSGDGIASQAFFSFPTGIEVNQDNGDVYVADTGNHMIRKISAGFVARLIGDVGVASNGAKTAVLSEFLGYGLNTPTNLFYDEDFDILYVNDFGNKRVLKIREALDVKQITTREVLYGGLGVYEDLSGKRYVLYQDMEQGDVYGREYLDSYEVLVFDQENALTSFPSEGYIYNNFIKDGDRYYFSNLNESTDVWTVFLADTGGDNITYYFGESGFFGNLSLFSLIDHDFSPFGDMFGNGMVSYVYARENPTTYSSALVELLLRYYFTETDEDATELSYSLMLGDAQ